MVCGGVDFGGSDEGGLLMIVPEPRFCVDCGKELAPGGKKERCRGCRQLAGETLPRRRSLMGEDELLEENEKIDALETAVEGMRSEGREVDAALLEECLCIWRRGKFPDGTRVKSESSRHNAFKILHSALGGFSEVGDLDIRFVLDAKLTCSVCREKMRADSRVSEEELGEAF